uniref:Uncharacterized protein n=1 Tax=Oryza brachyantha TaxID=4533 RepID=J3KTZ2_ORYBR
MARGRRSLDENTISYLWFMGEGDETSTVEICWVPDIEEAKKNKCQLTRTPYGRRFAHKGINGYLAFLFKLIVVQGPSVGLNVSLSRYDLFHEHLFLASGTGRLGILNSLALVLSFVSHWKLHPIEDDLYDNMFFIVLGIFPYFLPTCQSFQISLAVIFGSDNSNGVNGFVLCTNDEAMSQFLEQCGGYLTELCLNNVEKGQTMVGATRIWHQGYIYPFTCPVCDKTIENEFEVWLTAPIQNKRDSRGPQVWFVLSIVQKTICRKELHIQLFFLLLAGIREREDYVRIAQDGGLQQVFLGWLLYVAELNSLYHPGISVFLIVVYSNYMLYLGKAELSCSGQSFSLAFLCKLAKCRSRLDVSSKAVKQKEQTLNNLKALNAELEKDVECVRQRETTEKGNSPFWILKGMKSILARRCGTVKQEI